LYTSPTTSTSTLSLHDALPIYLHGPHHAALELGTAAEIVGEADAVDILAIEVARRVEGVDEDRVHTEGAEGGPEAEVEQVEVIDICIGLQVADLRHEVGELTDHTDSNLVGIDVLVIAALREAEAGLVALHVASANRDRGTAEVERVARADAPGAELRAR